MNEPVKLIITFKPLKIEHTLKPLIVRDSTIYHDYDGSYDVIPSVSSYELNTMYKHLNLNIVIESIPFRIVLNEKGYTAIIGD